MSATPATDSPVETRGGVPWPLPWVGHTRRNKLRDTAHTSLLAALRRLAAIPPKPPTTGPNKGGLDFTLDLADMDSGRATVNRVASAASWNALHPPTPRPFMYNLRHAGHVIRAVGLKPSYVYEVFQMLQITADSSDADLLTGAHLAGVSNFSGPFMFALLDLHGWTVDDLINWSTHHTADHLMDCQDVGMTLTELGGLLRANEVPDASQVQLLAAFLMPPPMSA